MKILLILSALLGLSFCNSQDSTFANTPEMLLENKPVTEQIVLSVYKDPNCGCCTKWIDHLNGNGLKTKAIDTNKIGSIKADYKIPNKFQSCHTGISKEGYFFEGHVPAKYIKQFLKEKPENALGLSVPAMPIGTPGMEMDNKFMPYKIFMLMENDEIVVYADIKSMDEQF